MVSVYIRLASGEKISFDVDLATTVKELKTTISSSQNVEAELITLVFKGKILKDEQKLEEGGLIDGSVIHMVVMKKKAASTAPKPSPVATPVAPTSQVTTPVKKEEKPQEQSNTRSSLFGSSPFSNLGSGFGLDRSNPSNGIGGRGLGQGLDGLSLNSDMTQGFMSVMKQNPEMFIEMLKMDPGFKNVLEKNPQMEAILHDPQTLDYLFEMMSDPESMKNAVRQADATMNEISSIPGGEQMLDRVLSQYYEPLDKAKDSKNFDKSAGDAHVGNPQETTLPNLWGNSASSSSSTTSTPTRRPNLFSESTSPFSGGMGGMDSMMNGSTDDLMMQLLGSNPELVTSMLKASPEYQALIKDNPMMEQMMSDPNYLKQLFSPENIKLMRQLEQSGFGRMGGFGGNMFETTEELTTDQLRQQYATQIAQIEEMGFVVDDNVLQTLHRFHGNVDRTIDFLINYDCLLQIDTDCFLLIKTMDKVPVLLDRVKSQCPNLCPVFYPAEVSEKQVMKVLKEKKRLPKASKVCSICEGNEGEMSPQVVCDYDLEKRRMIVKDVKCVCSSCKRAMNIHNVMNLLVNEPKDSEQVDSFIRHFLLVNGHNPNNIALMEEIVSSCYSLHIVLKGLLSSTVDYLSNVCYKQKEL